MTVVKFADYVNVYCHLKVFFQVIRQFIFKIQNIKKINLRCSLISQIGDFFCFLLAPN